MLSAIDRENRAWVKDHGLVVGDIAAARHAAIRCGGFAAHTDAVYAIAFSPATDTLASGSYDGTVKIWNAKTGDLLHSFVAAPGFSPL